jgi:Uma2 family endonuclease
MTQSTPSGATLTFEQAAGLDPDQMPGELDAGRWVAMTRGTWRHGRITGNVVFALKLYARNNPGWSVATADPGTKLGRRPDVLRGPDVGIVRAEREPKGRGAEGWLEGAPGVAVEVTGDDQSSSELLRRALEYLAAGAKMAWVLDPEAEQVVVVTPPDRIRVLSRADTLTGDDALPGFACSVAELFE